MVANRLQTACEKRNESWQIELQLVELVDQTISGHPRTGELDQPELEVHLASNSLSHSQIGASKSKHCSSSISRTRTTSR